MGINWEMYDEEFDAREEKQAYSHPPNGTYNVTLSGITGDTWDDGSPRLNFAFTIDDGALAGQEIRRSAGLNDYTKGDLAALGFKGWKLSAVVKNGHLASGARCIVKVGNDKNNKQQAYLNAVLSTPVTAPPPAVVTAPAPAPAQQAALPGVPVTVSTPFD